MPSSTRVIAVAIGIPQFCRLREAHFLVIILGDNSAKTGTNYSLLRYQNRPSMGANVFIDKRLPGEEIGTEKCPKTVLSADIL